MIGDCAKGKACKARLEIAPKASKAEIAPKASKAEITPQASNAEIGEEGVMS